MAKHAFSTSFSTSKFDVGEYTWVKTTEFNDMKMEMNRAREAEAKLDVGTRVGEAGEARVARLLLLGG